eukprot:7142789-Karenia_brevis.AAC.1
MTGPPTPWVRQNKQNKRSTTHQLLQQEGAREVQLSRYYKTLRAQAPTTEGKRVLTELPPPGR